MDRDWHCHRQMSPPSSTITVSGLIRTWVCLHYAIGPSRLRTPRWLVGAHNQQDTEIALIIHAVLLRAVPHRNQSKSNEIHQLYTLLSPVKIVKTYYFILSAVKNLSHRLNFKNTYWTHFVHSGNIRQKTYKVNCRRETARCSMSFWKHTLHFAYKAL